MELKLKAVSFAQTFVSALLTVLGGAFLTVDPSVLLNPQAWTTASIMAVVLAAVRVALKMAWEKTMPAAFGGAPRA